MALKPRTFRRVVLVGSLAGVVLLVLLGYFVVRPMQAQRSLDSKRVDGMAAAQAGDHVAATKLLNAYIKRDENPEPEVILAYARARAKVQTSDGGYIRAATQRYRQCSCFQRVIAIVQYAGHVHRGGGACQSNSHRNE